MWTNDTGIEVSATFKGITTPIGDLIAAIHGRGWEVTKVKRGTSGVEAEAKNPTTGQKIKKVAPTEDAAVAHLLLSLTRLDYIRTRWSRHKVGMWQSTFTDKLAQIAEAYAKAPAYDPKAAGAFLELAEDSAKRAEVLRQQLHIEVVDEPEPYANAQEMAEDIHKRKHFAVSRANTEHPILSTDQIVNFRIVHDILGHAASGGDFGWEGENRACAAHFPLLTPNAQKALFTNCIGQTAYAIYYRGFGPQKVCFLDDLLEDVQDKENPANHTGVHPSQSLVPTETPQAPPSSDQAEVSPFPKGWKMQPHVEEAINGTAPGGTYEPGQVFGSFQKNAGYIDPNEGWESGVEPLLGANGRTLRESENDPLGIYRPNANGASAWDVAQNLARIDPENPNARWWHRDENGDQALSRTEMKRAIVNAFSAVLLSPRKDLRWNTVHYQDIADIVHATDDPNYLHKRLEQRRTEWNRARKISPLAHKPYYREQQDFARFLKSKHPGMTDDMAHRQASQEVLRLLESEKSRIANELDVAEAGKPAAKRTTTSQIEIKAGAEVARILRDIMSPAHNPDTDFGDQLSFLGHTAGIDEWTGDDADRRPTCPRCEEPYEHPRERLHGCSNCGYMRGRDQNPLTDYEWWGENKGKYPGLEARPFPRDLRTVIPFLEPRQGAQPFHPPSQMSIQAPEGADIDPSVIEMFDGSVNPEAMGAYGAWMGDHLKSITQVSRHADGILDAALEDLGDRDHPRLQGYDHGAGHHFRAYVLSLGISGIGPKVTSFAWLLLAPELSQLATIDTHMMQVLGNKGGDESPSPRDYFKMERQFRGRLDAAGYQDLPLGLAQWAMWDYKRTGRDTHQDHAGLRPLNYVQHGNIDWNAKKPTGSDKWKPDPWWQQTEGIGDQIGQSFDQYEGEKFRKDEVPFQDDRRYVAITAAKKEGDEVHVAWDVPEQVRKQIADYVATLEWPDGHELEDPSDYHITAAYAPTGYHGDAAHALVEERECSDLPFEATDLDLFGPDKDAVVIRLDSPEATEVATKLMNALEDSGLDISRFEGGYKPHITVGTASELPEGDDPDFSFEGGKLAISDPRSPEEIKTSSVRLTALDDPSPHVIHPDGEMDTGAPGETAMKYLRSQLGLTTEQAWEFQGDVQKVR